MAKNIYRGFSTYEFQKNKTFKLNDVELVKMDILNHIFTRKGERVMMSEFGSIIPDLVFEPLDEETLDTLEVEIRRVLNADPRIALLDLTMDPLYDQNQVTVHIQVQYIELNIVGNIDLNITFEGNE